MARRKKSDPGCLSSVMGIFIVGVLLRACIGGGDAPADRPVKAYQPPAAPLALTPAPSLSSTAPAPMAALEQEEATKPAQKDRWLNSNSGERHNSFCRWYQKTKAGRMCYPSEGNACAKCGG